MMTPTQSQQIRAVAVESADLRTAQIDAGAWTACIAAMVSLLVVQSPMALLSAGVFTLAAFGVWRRWAWPAALSAALLLLFALSIGTGLLPMGSATRIPLSLMSAAGALCLGGAYLTLRDSE
jgi:hypothetical protein